MLKPLNRPMLHVTMRQLEVFESVARLGTFTRAAEELFLSQPAVSAQMKQLVDAVGEPLFEQRDRTILLTRLGEELYRTCREMFDTWRTFEHVVLDTKSLKAGRLRIACAITAGTFMRTLVESFRAAHPGIDVVLESAHRDALLERLARKADDLYVMTVPPQHFDISAEPFLANPLVAIAPKAHELALQRDIPPIRLARERFFLPERGSGTRLSIDRWFRERGIELDAAEEVPAGESSHRCVARGLGVAVVSRQVLAADGIESEVAVLDVAGFPIDQSWFLVSPRNRAPTAAARAFADFLGNEAAQHLPERRETAT
jgi:LysR family transcriptional regulator, low CO2-responsive transcriptional regulator